MGYIYNLPTRIADQDNHMKKNKSLTLADTLQIGLSMNRETSDIPFKTLFFNSKTLHLHCDLRKILLMLMILKRISYWLRSFVCCGPKNHYQANPS